MGGGNKLLIIKLLRCFLADWWMDVRNDESIVFVEIPCK